MPENHPLVSYIVVNYNQLAYTCELFDSIRKNSFRNYEIILVDNASKENPAKHIAEHYPEVRVIVTKKNLGFAGGNNIAIPECRGEFLFFVNNDTEFTGGLIEGLLALFAKIPKLGMVSPKLCYYPEDTGGKQIIQYAGSTGLSPYTARNTTIGYKEEDVGQYTQAQSTRFVHGAAMMVPRKVIEDVGLMWENYFLYYEEMDWCERMHRAGYQVYVEPNVLIFHKESVSVGQLSAFKTYYHARNRILFMRRNKSSKQLFIFYFFFIFVTVPKNVLLYVINREWDHLNSFWKGILWNIQHKDIHFQDKLAVVKTNIPVDKSA